jgi:ribosome biogenesis GTPase
VVAANVDVVIIVCAMGRDVNVHRIERFVTLARAGGALPVLVLNKADTVDDPAPHVERARQAAPGVELHVVSARTGGGLDALQAHLAPGRTIVLLGTSGAGKSTIVNRWLGADALSTGALGAAGKGRHTTTGRQLLLLPSGAAVIDTPGLREVGLWGADEGVTEAFDDVAAAAAGCRFRDCAHAGEPGCAVEAAVTAGTLERARVDAWRRLRLEQTHQAQQTQGPVAAGRKRTERMGSKALRARLRDKRR